jgi:hypothetical protein
MFAQTFPGGTDPMNVSASAALGARQLAANVAVVLKDIEMAPFQRFGVVVTTHRALIDRAPRLFPQADRLFDLKEDAVIFIEPAIDHLPLVA